MFKNSKLMVNMYFPVILLSYDHLALIGNQYSFFSYGG